MKRVRHSHLTSLGCVVTGGLHSASKRRSALHTMLHRYRFNLHSYRVAENELLGPLRPCLVVGSGTIAEAPSRQPCSREGGRPLKCIQDEHFLTMKPCIASHRCRLHSVLQEEPCVSPQNTDYFLGVVLLISTITCRQVLCKK